MKGIAIPINTLVILAIAVIVLLAAVAWFMGAFGPTATQQSLKQKFDSSCTTWVMTNCDKTGDGDDIPDQVCLAYNKLMFNTDLTTCSFADAYTTVAKACGCTEPFGTERPLPP